MKTFSIALVAALAISAVQAETPPEVRAIPVPPIYVPFASFYEHGQYVRSIIIADKDGTVTWYPSLAKCRDAIFAQLEHAMGSAPEGGTINATCVPVPSMDLPRK
jgi:hypothetical protein